jgi:hypothetical protein
MFDFLIREFFPVKKKQLGKYIYKNLKRKEEELSVDSFFQNTHCKHIGMFSTVPCSVLISSTSICDSSTFLCF